MKKKKECVFGIGCYRGGAEGGWSSAKQSSVVFFLSEPFSCILFFFLLLVACGPCMCRLSSRFVSCLVLEKMSRWEEKKKKKKGIPRAPVGGWPGSKNENAEQENVYAEATYSLGTESSMGEREK